MAEIRYKIPILSVRALTAYAKEQSDEVYSYNLTKNETESVIQRGSETYQNENAIFYQAMQQITNHEFTQPQVDTVILLSGIALVSHVVGVRPLTLAVILLCAAAVIGFLWYKTGKFNTVAVLIGAVGYLMIYASMITLSIRSGAILPVVLYALAICLFVFLCLVGILSNLKNAKVHWVIEISNVICQFSVALATAILLWR